MRYKTPSWGDGLALMQQFRQSGKEHNHDHSGERPSFARDIQPLFRPADRVSMRWAFDLGSYQDVRAHAQAILGRLASGTMPCDGKWPEEQITLFRRWVEAGMPA